VPNAPSDVDPQRNSVVADAAPQPLQAPPATPNANAERGGPSGPEPTRYGDWERKGRCIDF
jgi:hypothetical protein